MSHAQTNNHPRFRIQRISDESPQEMELSLAVARYNDVDPV